MPRKKKVEEPEIKDVSMFPGKPGKAEIVIDGLSGLIHHSGVAGLATHSPIKTAISKITSRLGRNRTEEVEKRLIELECQNSLWLNTAGDGVIVPSTAIRACIEAGARQLKQGADVRGGLLVLSTDFEYNAEIYGDSIEQLAQTTQFTVPVRVQRARTCARGRSSSRRGRSGRSWSTTRNWSISASCVSGSNWPGVESGWATGGRSAPACSAASRSRASRS